MTSESIANPSAALNQWVTLFTNPVVGLFVEYLEHPWYCPMVFQGIGRKRVAARAGSPLIESFFPGELLRSKIRI
jgi:hypothetical protein